MQMNEVTLETERLVLRWFRETDFPQYLAMSSDPEVMKFLSGTPQTEIEAWKSMAAFMGHWYFRGYGVWGVEEKSSGKLIGRIGFMDPAGRALNWDGRWRARVGARVMRPKARAGRWNTHSTRCIATVLSV